MSKKIAIITGITGQDGSYLADFLLKKEYVVHGIKRRSSQINTERIDYLYKDPHVDNRRFILHYGDMTDSLNITNILQQVQPDEIYNLAAQSHVKVSFETPEYTANADALGTLRMLEAIRSLGLQSKFYQASTSELYGLVQEVPQKESTPFYPRSPYGVAKLYAYWITVNYREAYNMFACNGILFNHESPRRGEVFVTRKITRAIARIILGLQKCCYLGNLDAKRDWGHAKDYVRAMWMMMQHSSPDDWVVATGKTCSVRDFLKLAFAYVGVELAFEGKGEEETAVVAHIDTQRVDELTLQSEFQLARGDVVIKVDKRYYRPTEVELLLGDPSKANNELGWYPEYNMQDLINEMMEYDINLMKKELFIKDGGYSIRNFYE